MKTIKVRVIFADGLDKIQDIPCPADDKGALYLPEEFTTARPDLFENVIVRSDPFQTQNAKFPVYREVKP